MTRIKRAIGIVLMIASASAGVVLTNASPVSAGVGYWSTSGCTPAYSGAPEVWWWAEPDGSGTWYWQSDRGTTWVGGDFMRTYTRNNWECGRLGAVRGPWYRFAQDEWRQQFEHGFISYWRCEWWVWTNHEGWRYEFGTYCGELVPHPNTGGRQ